MVIVDAEKELEQKRLAARQAMEGPDWTAKREREEGERKNAVAAEQLKKSLAVIEKKRQTTQAARQEAEKDKWGYQEKLWQLELVIETNTVKYRALLDREDEAKKQLTELHV